MSRYAEPAPRQTERKKLDSLVIRGAVEGDIAELARIAAEREGDDPELHVEPFRKLIRESRSGECLVLAAVVGSEMIGFAKVAYFRPPAGSPPETAPEGWYLAGVVVDPRWRRAGVGDRLTRSRLDWIARRGDRAYSFANERNRVSLDLHRRFGFVEVTRSFTFPSVTFEGGSGILFQIDLRRWMGTAP